MQLLLRINSWRLKWLYVMSLLAFLFSPISLLEAAEGKRIAFVVGIGTYDHLAADKQLKNAVNDADGVFAKLTEIGFHVTKGPNLTRSAFNKKWQDIIDSLTKDDTFVLYFSGHGVQIDGHNYLLPRDIPYIEYGRDEHLKREAISLNELLADLSTGDRAHPQSSVVILDACRDNPLIPPGYKSASMAKGLAGLPESDGIFVIYAAASNRTALDRLSSSDPATYSVFTRTLLPLMGRMDLSIQELSNELKDQVWKLAKSAGREQRPTYYDGIVGRFCLPGCATKAEKEPVKQKEKVTTPVHPTVQNEITGMDGAPMVLIPAGEFWMGSPDDDGDKDEHPRHRVGLSAFYLDKFEVTNRRFEQFVRERSHWTTAEQEGKAWALTSAGGWEEISGAQWRKPEGGDSVFLSNREEYPVVSVSWEDANAYCRWSGKRLPTEAEFEYATRAGTETKYWWGNSDPGGRRVANIADETARRRYPNWTITTGYGDGYVRTAPVGLFDVNPFGLYDMIGNVWEWTADWYGEHYYQGSPPRNPQGPSSGEHRVLRGGSWGPGPGNARSAHRLRLTPSKRFDDIGFRCAQDVPGTQKQMTTSADAQELSPPHTVDSVRTIAGKDGAPMMLIPVGEFMMGDDKRGQNDERPAHRVYLDGYYIDKYEVTTDRYATFFQETKRGAPKYRPEQTLMEHRRKPVVGVDWNDATAYCAWAGKRLPTEAEWEKAARGTDQRLYPWGNAAPSVERANYSRGYDFKGYGVLTDVGSFEKGKSPYGAYDMAGNVWEWTADWYDENSYGKSSLRNPTGSSSGQYRVVRGGSWSDDPVDVRSANRLWLAPTAQDDSIGFRCAQDIPK